MKTTIMKPLLVSVLLTSTTVDARELLGFGDLTFGMEFAVAKSLTQNKPNFEVWQRENSDENNLKFDVNISGISLGAVAYFVEGKVNGFRASSFEASPSESDCRAQYINIISKLEERYGQITNPAISQGIWYKADFGFSNNRHINAWGLYDKRISMCQLVVSYENEKLTRKMPETSGTKSAEDKF